MEVALWQVGIFAGIVFTSAVFGRPGLTLSVGIAAVWTVVMIFTSWLMILQFVTIAIAGLVGLVVCDRRAEYAREKQARDWGAFTKTGSQFLGLALVGGAFLLHELNPSHFRNFDLGAFGIAFGYGLAFLAAALVGGTLSWLVAGMGWRNWSIDVFRVGGLIVAVGLGLAMLQGQRALQEFTTQGGGREDWSNVPPVQEVTPRSAIERPAPRNTLAQAMPTDSAGRGGDKDKYMRLVRDYEKRYPEYDATSPQYDAIVVSETLTRKAYYQFVEGVGAAVALELAVKDMLTPPENRRHVSITSVGAGQCNYYGSGNRKFVSLTGICPPIGISSDR